MSLIIDLFPFARGFCVDGRFCAEAEIVDSRIEFTLHSSSTGWMALGVGSSMLSADIFCFWMGSTEIILSRRTARGFQMPAHNPHREGIMILPSKTGSPQWAKLSVSFSTPAGYINVSSMFIYAQGNTVDNPDSSSSNIGFHNLKGEISGLVSEPAKAKPSAINSDSVNPTAKSVPTIPTVSKTGSAKPEASHSGASNNVDINKSNDDSLESISQKNEPNSFCDASQSFCVYGRRHEGNLIWTIHTNSDGWAAFGFGSSMSNADIFVFWRNNGGYTLSRRKSEGYSLPAFNSDKQGIKIVDLDVSAPSWSKMAVSFVKPVDYEAQNDPKYIYALGTSVIDPNSEASGFNRHFKKGGISGVDFLSSSNSSPLEVGNISNNDSSNIFHNKFCDFNAKDQGTTSKFCLYGRPVNDSVLFTLHSSASGWAGFGVGSTMRNADMYVFWKNSTGDGYTVSRRKSDDVSMPTYNSDPGHFSLAPLDVTTPYWAQISLSFVFGNSVGLSAKSEFIFAHSNKTVEDPDSPRSIFLKHDKNGKITGINYKAKGISSDNVNSSDSDDDDQYFAHVHGILMLIAWSIAPFSGIFVARYLKGVLGVWWFWIHVFLMLFVTGLFTVVAFALIYAHTYTSLLSSGVHGKLGLSIVLIMCFQITLGFICNALWSAERKTIPWQDKLHWWVGRIVFLLGLINIYFGIKLYTEMYSEPFALSLGYWISMVLGIGSLIFGQFKFGQNGKSS